MQRVARVHQRQPMLVFGRPFVRRFAICYSSVVLSVLSVSLSVTLVYCGQTAAWMDQDTLGTEVGLGPGDIVLDGDQAPPQTGAQQPPTFWPMTIVGLWPAEKEFGYKPPVLPPTYWDLAVTTMT